MVCNSSSSGGAGLGSVSAGFPIRAVLQQQVCKQAEVCGHSKPNAPLLRHQPAVPDTSSPPAAREGTKSAAKAFDRWFGTPKLVRETSRKPLIGRGSAPVEKTVEQVWQGHSIA